MKRLFFGIDIPEERKAALLDVVQEGRKRLRNVKWVPIENMHVTLKFLGNTPDALVGDVVRAAEASAAGIPALTLRLKGLGAFPSPSKPRIIWMGLEGDLAGLANLAELLGLHLQPLGFEEEERPFTAHVTLGRASERDERGSFLELYKKHERQEYGQFVATEFVLFQSDLTPRGPIYTPLERVKLGS